MGWASVVFMQQGGKRAGVTPEFRCPFTPASGEWGEVIYKGESNERYG